MPDASLLSLLARVNTRRRIALAADGLAVAGAVFGPALLIGIDPVAGLWVAAIAGAIVVTRRWSAGRIELARRIEAADARHDNLIITAAELLDRPRPLRADIRDAIERQAVERAATVRVANVIPLARPVGVAAAVLIGCIVLATDDGRAVPPQSPGTAREGHTVDEGSIAVSVTPPAYTGRQLEVHADPMQITVLGGSEIRITAASRVLREWTAERSEALELRSSEQAPARFLSVIVVPDAAPSVRIERPGRDMAFATGATSLAVAIDGRDDLGLSSLALRYTTASGGGENVTFTEGEIPLSIERVSDREWRARTTWPLEPLGLVDGDVVVYRAVARDRNPNGRAVESDAFIVEIGRASEIASAGFALPTEDRKYAISQQMVIYKTERLIRERARHAEDWLEQTRGIAIEQRMVRAEVVFLGGGDVEDEVEEAAHSHELAEGRLQNEGRAEMLRAINFMSRAEAQLNDGRADEALGLERQALASLERALDRRRYFLRTLPDRSRIDATRRLTGDRNEARPWTRDAGRAQHSADARIGLAMGELARAQREATAGNAALAARIAALDPTSEALQRAAVAIASATTPEGRRAALDAAMDAVAAHALRSLPAASPIYLQRDPLAGRLTDAQSRRRP